LYRHNANRFGNERKKKNGYTLLPYAQSGFKQQMMLNNRMSEAAVFIFDLKRTMNIKAIMTLSRVGFSSVFFGVKKW